jgi:hypothetical protein
VCDFPGLEPDEGCEPLRATVRTNLTFDELDAIPVAVFVEDGTVMYRSTAEMRAAIAPYVLAWNIDADDVETGETVPVIPPAEAGPDVLRTVDPLITVWLASRLKTIHIPSKEDRGKDTPPSEATDAPSPSGDTSTPSGSEPSSTGADPETSPTSPTA